MCKKVIYLVSFVLVLSVAGNASADLVAHWAFDEGSGTIAFDSSGNDNDGTLIGGLKWVTGKIGGALEFNGTDSIIDIPYSPSMTPSDGTTMSAWVFPTDTTRSCIVGQFQGYGMALLGGLQLKSVIWGADWVLSDVTIPMGEWSHVAMTWDVTNAERMIFLNGELVGQRGDSAVPNVQNNMGIGLWVGWTGGDDSFMGIIDDVRIYDHILSEVELLGAMTGEVFPYAFGPTPEDGAILEATWVNISWKPGGFAVSHDVYIGENFDDVNTGAEGTFLGNQAVTNLIVGLPGFPYPDGLVPGTTYYWRIDEVDDGDRNSPWIGDVWSFWIPPRTADQVDSLINFDDTNYNILLGTNAFNNDVGQYNIGLGYQAGRYNDTTATGEPGGLWDYVDEGEYNVFIGHRSGYGGTPGENNTGGANVGIGTNTLHMNTMGFYNIAIGQAALYENTIGFQNIGIGDYALQKNTTGFNNVAVGRTAGLYNVEGKENTFLGASAGRGVEDDSVYRNVMIGYRAGFTNQGNDNTFIGFRAGEANTTGASSVFLGMYAGHTQTTTSNLLIIDNQDRGSVANEQSKALIYGTFDAEPENQVLTINGKVGIGVASPNAKLDVEGSIYPHTDNAYYIGKNDDDTPFAWKGIILKDTTNGKYYRIEIINGTITATDLTD